MENMFTIENDGNYIKTTLNWDAPTVYLKRNIDTVQFHSSKEDVDKYVKAASDFLDKFKKLINDSNFKYDPFVVLASNLSNIEAWTCSITVMSKYSIDDAANMLLNNYDRKFKKNTEELEKLVERRKQDFHSLSLKEEERLNELNGLLNYGLDNSLLEYGGSKLLDGIIEKTNELLNAIKK